MKLDQIEDFVALADTGGIRAAARRRGVSQPVVTRHIRELERELGAALVRRSSSGAALTDDGLAFLQHARAICHETRKAANEMARRKGAFAEELAIGAAPGPAVTLLPWAVERFRKLHPEVTVNIVECFPQAAINRLRDGSLACLIGPRGELSASADITIQPLVHTEVRIVVRKGHAMRNVRSLGAIVDKTWVGGPSRGMRAVAHACAEAGMPTPAIGVRCESFAAMIAIVANSDMFGLTIRETLESGLAGDLVEPLNLKERMPVTNYLFTRVESPVAAPVAALLKLIRQAARNRR